MPADLVARCERTCGIYLDKTVFTSHTSFVAVSIETPCNHFETKRTALGSTANLTLLLRLMGNEFSGQFTPNRNVFYTRSFTISTSAYITIKPLSAMTIKRFIHLNMKKLRCFKIKTRTSHHNRCCVDVLDCALN